MKALEPPRDLTLPEPSSTTTRQLLGRYLRFVTDQLFRIPMGRFPAPVFDDFADVRAVLERLLRDKRAGVVFSMLRRPTVSTLIRCVSTELRGGGDVRKRDAWLTELTAELALELSAAGELPPDGIRLRAHPERLLSPALGFALGLPDRARLGFRPGRLVLEHDGRELELDLELVSRHELQQQRQPDLPGGVVLARPYFSIDGDIHLAIADNNPLSDFEAHPEKSGNQIDLGGRKPAEWVDALRAALALVDAHLPELGAEIRLLMHQIVPVGYHPERHLSASYAEAIGTAYLTLHPDVMTMTEALIHEFSHNKLNLLWALDPVLENAFSPLYSSPVRPDPRPLHGVMLAVHAFVPVARLYERMLESGHQLAQSAAFARRFAQIVEGNHEGWLTLREHARATPQGRGVLDELGRWDEHFARQ